MTKRTPNSEVFYDRRITNADIYNELMEVKKMLTITQNMAKKAILVSSGAMGLTVIVLGFLIAHINK